MVMGRVDQLYYAYLPPGGIKAKDETFNRAEAAARLQQTKDLRGSRRNPLQCLGVALYVYCHELVQEFVDVAGHPYEFKRKMFHELINLMHSTNEWSIDVVD